MKETRTVKWGGIHNARDLGGLRGSLGVTRYGRVFRMPRPDGLDEIGWRDLERAGVRTLVDLRNEDEIAALPLRPSTVASVHRPIEDPSDEDFMSQFGEFLGTPSYYPENLRRWPAKIAAVVGAIAEAPAGGVAFHCSAGRDRTGLIAALVLTVVGVDKSFILDDYERGVREYNAHLAAQDVPREPVRSDDYLTTAIEDARRSLELLLDTVDVESYLRHAGLTGAQLDSLRRRLLSP